MDTILFLETTKSGTSLDAIITAPDMGYKVVLFTKKKNLFEEKRNFSFDFQIRLVEEMNEQNIREEISDLQNTGINVKAIIGMVDPYVSLAAKLSNEICKSTISNLALKTMENKMEVRKKLCKNGTTPKFEILEPTNLLYEVIEKETNFPLIVKSAVSKASKDVYLAENKYEMEIACKNIRRLYPAQTILLEEYLDGPQYLVEVLVHEEKITVVAIFKQEIKKRLKFIVTGYDLQLNLEESFYKKLYHAVESIIKDLDVTNAACHLEFRYVRDSWKLVEINPRVSGGAMNRIIEEAFGINLVKEVINLTLGNEPDLTKKFRKHVYTQYIIINTPGYLLKIEGVNIAKQQPGVKEVFTKPRIGDVIIPAVSMGYRYGYVIAIGETEADAKANAVKAANKILFYLEPV